MACFLSQGERGTRPFPCQKGYAKNTCQPSGKAWLHTATQRGANHLTGVKIGWIKTQGGVLIWEGEVRVKPSWRTLNLPKLQHRLTPTAEHKQKHSFALLESNSHRAPALQSGVHGEPLEMGRREQVLMRPGASKAGNLATHFLRNPRLKGVFRKGTW